MLCFFSPTGLTNGAFLYSIATYFADMDEVTDQSAPLLDPITTQKQRVEAATDFLSICDRLSTGYDSGYYWEDAQ